MLLSNTMTSQHFECDFSPVRPLDVYAWVCRYICLCLTGTSSLDSFLFLRVESVTAAGDSEWVNISSLIEEVRIIIFYRQTAALILMQTLHEPPHPEGLLTRPWKIMQNNPRTLLCMNASSYENAMPHKWNICFWFTDEL